MQEELKRVINDIHRWQDLMHASERDVEFYAIEPLFPLLGWKLFEVSRQYSVGTEDKGIVDYCLQIGGSGKVFLEAKAGNEDLRVHQEQLVVYTAKHGVQLAVLTNGHRWWFYLPLEEGPWETKRFCEIDLEVQTHSEVASALCAFLSREAVLTGAAVNEAKARLANLKKEREITEYLPEAWDSLVTDTRGPLFDLIAETVEKGCGHKPEAGRVQRFLEEMKRREPEPINGKPPPPVRRIPKKPNLRFEEIDVPVGATLTFRDDPTIQCVVVDQVNQVKYNEQQYSIARLSANLKGYKAAQGSLYWLYGDETLQKRRERLEDD